MSGPLRVFLAGEGRSELGSRAGHPAYQSGAQPGVIEILLRRVQAVGWEVCGAREWKSVRNLQVGIGANDTKRVLALALDAIEADCGVLAFTRDRDNDHERPAAVQLGVERARAAHQVDIIGEVAVPVLEGWALAMRGMRDTEELSPGGAKTKLSDIGLRGASALADAAREADLDSLPDDACSLRKWLSLGRAVLSDAVASR